MLTTKPFSLGINFEAFVLENGLNMRGYDEHSNCLLCLIVSVLFYEVVRTFRNVVNQKKEGLEKD